jgi:transposase
MHRYKAAYSAAFRQQIVELVQSGRKPKDLAQEFGCHITSIHHWVAVANGGVSPVNHVSTSASTPNPSAALSSAERQELIELRRKLRQVQMETDILAKATAWFANQSEKV